MEKMLVLGATVVSYLLMLPCFFLGRLANLHNPAAGLDKTLAYWSLFFGLLANLTGFGIIIYVFICVLRHKS
jgi:hypothetical protein